MTDLLSPPTKRTSASAASRGPVARPLWLGAGFAGAVAAGAMLTACMAVGLVGWFASDAGSHGDTRDALRVGADAWLLAHGAGLTLEGATIGVVPLGLTALCGYVAFRLGRWARLTSADEDGPAVALAALVLAGVYAVVAVVTAVLATLPTAEPGLMPAFAGAFGLALLGGGAGLVRTDRRTAAMAARVPETAVAVVRGGVGVVLVVLAAGAALVTGALVLDLGTAASVLSRLHADAAGSALYTLLVAAVAPNAALLGSAYLLGPGFAVGTGTVVSPTAVVLGPVPAFPLLAALPAPGPGPAWATGFVAVPVLLAAAVGALTVRRHPTTAYETGALRGLGAGVVGGVLVTVLVHLAGGSAGPGRMADVGAPFLDTLAAAVVALGIGSLLGAVLATWRTRRHGPPAGEDDRDPSTEDTIRL
jgi:hypothetical protein